MEWKSGEGQGMGRRRRKGVCQAEWSGSVARGIGERKCWREGDVSGVEEWGRAEHGKQEGREGGGGGQSSGVERKPRKGHPRKERLTRGGESGVQEWGRAWHGQAKWRRMGGSQGARQRGTGHRGKEGLTGGGASGVEVWGRVGLGWPGVSGREGSQTEQSRSWHERPSWDGRGHIQQRGGVE